MIVSVWPPMSRWRQILTAVAAFLLVLLAACAGSPTATPLPTPTPVPTSTPVPGPVVSQPITADPGTDLQAFLEAIPAEERECLATKWGQPRIAEVRTRSDLSVDEFRSGQLCISNNTVARIVAGRFVAQIGDLSDSSLQCIAEVDFSGLSSGVGNLRGTLSGSEGGPGTEGFDQAVEAANRSISSVLGATIPSLFCLNAAERASMESSATFVFPGIDAMECVTNELGEGGLAVMIEHFVASRLSVLFPGEAPKEPTAVLQAAMSGCGLDIG